MMPALRKAAGWGEQIAGRNPGAAEAVPRSDVEGTVRGSGQGNRGTGPHDEGTLIRVKCIVFGSGIPDDVKVDLARHERSTRAYEDTGGRR